MRPLNDRAPGVPWIGLAHCPTPVQQLNWPLATKTAVWAKRDDLTSPLYGGNKVRKLEYLFGQALAENRTTVLTFGAVGSNHVLATARHAASVGLTCIAILSRQVSTPFLPANLAAMIRAGAVLRSCPHFSDIGDAARSEIETWSSAHGDRPMLIPPGGSSATGALGYVNAAFEIDLQIKHGLMPEPDAIYMALGTMGSVVGLGLGLAAAGRRCRIVAVKVVHDMVANVELLRDLWGKTNESLRHLIPGFPAIDLDDRRVEVREQYFGDAYAVPTPEGLTAIEKAARAGLRLEPTYTGKTMAALIDDAARVGKDRNLLFWNTANSRPLAPASGVNTDGIDEELRAYLQSD